MSEETKKAETTKGGASVDSKAMLKKAAQEKRKVKYGERMTIEIIKETKHYKKGQIIAPHTVWAEELIKEKIAKKVIKE